MSQVGVYLGTLLAQQLGKCCQPRLRGAEPLARRVAEGAAPRELRRRLGDRLGERRVQPLGLALGAAQLL